MSTPIAGLTPADAAARLARHAKHYGAGAFATPTRAEIESAPDRLHVWNAGRTLGWGRPLTVDSHRRDWTGRPITLPRGSWVLTHLAHDGPVETVPDLGEWDYVFAYREDQTVEAALRAAGRNLAFTRISAAAEIIGCWHPSVTERVEAPWDQATVTRLPDLQVPPLRRQAMLDEVLALAGWHDDFPFYSDGTWSALSLRGFRPDDPTWGIKPSEMPRDWKAGHPEAAGYRCDWTTLADRCPTLRRWVDSVSWWDELERVRLLRMAARPGKGGHLARHTDITDKDAGTHDGQVVRFHLPLITDPSITMSAWELDGTRLVSHLPAFTCWYLDARKPHAVDNPSDVDRVHLVVDVISSPTVRGKLAQAVAA